MLSGGSRFAGLSGMALRFDVQKSTQLVARLLQRSGGTQNVLKLLKLVYLADRRALVEGVTG